MGVEAGAKVNKADKFGYTPLHVAALNESSQLVTLLLNKGADVTTRTRGGVSALSFIVRRTPDVMTRFTGRFDSAVTLHDHELGDVDCELRLDFRALVPGVGRGETDLMLCLVEVGQGHVLQHPLCESFLYLKWLRIRKFFLFSLIFHAIFVTIFTSYVIVTYLWGWRRTSEALSWPVLAVTCVHVCKELFQLAHGVGVYLRRWENWLQWAAVTTTWAVAVTPLPAACSDGSAQWQHHVAAFGILLVWTELMMVVGRFPMFGLYVQMFTQVACNFFKFLGAYLCLIVGFSLGFTVLHRNYKSFANPLVGLLKTIIMMSGELEFEDVFYDEEAPLLYPGSAHIMLLGFVVLITIILTNLMVGLAVSDIQELRRCAGLDRLVRRAELVAHLEGLLFSRLLDYAPNKIINAFRSGASLLHMPHHCAIHIRPNDPRESRLPRELIKSVYRLASEKRMRGKSARTNSSSARYLNRLHSSVAGGGGGGGDNNKQQQQQQLSDLAEDIKRCSLNFGQRLDLIARQVEQLLVAQHSQQDDNKLL